MHCIPPEHALIDAPHLFRSLENDVRFVKPNVSRVHARILFDETSGQGSLEVLGANGATLNGIHEPCAEGVHTPLCEGDLLVVAKEYFRVRYPGGTCAPLPQSEEEQIVQPIRLDTPARATPVRRRMRMSLVAAADIHSPEASIRLVGPTPPAQTITEATMESFVLIEEVEAQEQPEEGLDEEEQEIQEQEHEQQLASPSPLNSTPLRRPSLSPQKSNRKVSLRTAALLRNSGAAYRQSIGGGSSSPLSRPVAIAATTANLDAESDAEDDADEDEIERSLSFSTPSSPAPVPVKALGSFHTPQPMRVAAHKPRGRLSMADASPSKRSAFVVTRLVVHPEMDAETSCLVQQRMQDLEEEMEDALTDDETEQPEAAEQEAAPTENAPVQVPVAPSTPRAPSKPASVTAPTPDLAILKHLFSLSKSQLDSDAALQSARELFGAHESELVALKMTTSASPFEMQCGEELQALLASPQGNTLVGQAAERIQAQQDAATPRRKSPIMADELRVQSTPSVRTPRKHSRNPEVEVLPASELVVAQEAPVNAATGMQPQEADESTPPAVEAAEPVTEAASAPPEPVAEPTADAADVPEVATTDEATQEPTSELSEEPATEPTATGRGRKPAAAKKGKTSRTSKKASSEAEKERPVATEEAPAAPALAKCSRAKKAPAKAVSKEVADEAQSSSDPAAVLPEEQEQTPAPAPAKRSRTKKAPAKAAPEITQPSSDTVEQETAPAEQEEAAPAPAKRSRAKKAPAAEVEAPAAPAPKRARGKKAAVASADDEATVPSSDAVHADNEASSPLQPSKKQSRAKQTSALSSDAVQADTEASSPFQPSKKPARARKAAPASEPEAEPAVRRSARSRR